MRGRRGRPGFAVRLGIERDIEACVELVVAIGEGRAAAWWDTLTKTVADGVHRALFVAEAEGSVVGYGRVVYAAPPDAEPAAAPKGWYLLGLVVDEAWRRRGIGETLTTARMGWVAQRADRVYYFTSRHNVASQALHRRLGFVEYPGDWVPPGGSPRDAATQRFYYADLRQAPDGGQG